MHRRAFTIAELVVSIGVLSILLVMAGSIFTLTLKSSGDATSLIEVHEAIKALEDNLREDLRYVEPERSMMVIQGNTIYTDWTADDREADPDGDPATGVSFKRDPEREFVDVSSGSAVLRAELPRADLLMLFTARPGRSFRDPDVTGRLQHVVYGHAEIGEQNRATGLWSQTPIGYSANAIVDPTSGSMPTQQHPIPARQWHLARRSTLIVDQPLNPAVYYPADAIDDTVATGSDPDPTYSTLPETNWLRDGRRDYIVNATNPAGNSTVDFNYEKYVVKLFPNLQNETLNGTAPSGYPGWVANNPGQPPATWSHWLVPWFARSQLDLTPPVSQARRIGHHLLPHCASFKVEWTFDLSETDIGPYYRRMIEANGGPFWVDPANMPETNSRLQTLIASVPGLPTDPLPPNDPQTVLTNRLVLGDLAPDIGRFGYQWVGGRHGFFARDPNATTVDYAPDLYFPKLLRITVDVYDSSGRLARPIRHVMILPVGTD